MTEDTNTPNQPEPEPADDEARTQQPDPDAPITTVDGRTSTGERPAQPAGGNNTVEPDERPAY